MNINKVITNAPDTKKAATLTFIGVFGSLLLKLFTIIGEVSFVTLILVSVGIGLIIYFEKSIQSFKFGLSGVEATRVLEAMVAKETEPPPSNEIYISGQLPQLRGFAVATDDKTQSVIKALGYSNYSFRYLESLSNDSGLPIIDVKEILNWLLVNDFAIEFQGVEGKVYSLTNKGRHVFSSIAMNINV